jgi:hypothetical protein
VEEQKGVPGISRITWFWALVFTFFTSGVFAMGVSPLPVYLGSP